MSVELLGWAGIVLMVGSLACIGVMVWRAPLRPDLAAVDEELDELASGRETGAYAADSTAEGDPYVMRGACAAEPARGEAPVEPPAWRDWMGERVEKPWPDPFEDAHQRRLFA